jgi:uncharacterized protein YqgC (DUF456 family)
MNDKLRSAIIGGIVIGLLSGLPYVELVNAICCLWIIMGGALAAYLYIKKSKTPVNIGEGALIGAISGAIGTAVELIVCLPVRILTGYPDLHLLLNLVERADPQKAEEYRRRVDDVMSLSFTEQFFRAVFSWGTLLGLLITVVFALVGGLIAIPLFEKRKTDAGPPPPPPFYGGTPGGAYASAPPPPPDTYGPSAQ